MNIKLSVVDQSPVHGSHSLRAAPGLTLELARLCDELGYHRYWVAEHHDSMHFANPCPEILVATIAAQTQRIRVGSGGVMLSHYSPLKVAECFRMLATLHPDRIDLGIGRAPGGSSLSSAALAFPHRPLQGDIYEQQAQLLGQLLEGSVPANSPFKHLSVMPDNTPTPERWMLGSSGGSAGLAGKLGYDLALARFIAPDQCQPSIFDHWQQAWQQAGHQRQPNKLLGIACICAATEDEAKLRAGTAVYRKLTAQQGMPEDFLTPEQVQDRYRQMSPSAQAGYDHILSGYTVGTADQCLTDIEQLSRRFNCQEFALVTVTHSHYDRMESYRLLAQQQ
ncbi:MULTISPECIES: MsnO8 family LLM class oxidoreductase [unclassified Oceanobacter]|uniref:MsnO8 family LLM class oxidoreductase n=2 Tax=unclassified Oceanobacter TaxID=2620260 RepID=UPI0026E34F97|nr:MULTISPECIES: MsnO8 family LLM class oxidoreductase [unclassified Oceanobacter]MDO6683716.1 MsnO8 family LLM class oxidoreductase [Oceanobacter sp. 5_MG-2023]MDP2506364.1 MsnO8 family LLM class oxidoreductase [Oceanobacter sp. 3_MG-2023]MDP2549328.1 MsnO8 family LLM class oxidoreductase [Oceanobacter sp. 4_MG-2023]